MTSVSICAQMINTMVMFLEDLPMLVFNLILVRIGISISIVIIVTSL